MADNLPQKYGKYVLLRKIAMGGMAEIFRAKTTGAEGFEKTIVIKRILPHFTEDEDFVKMFIDEATIASKLQHSNIVQIHDFDKEDDRFYIAMEYVEGCDLKDVIERGLKAGRPLSPPQCAWIMMEIAKGLHYAHTKEHNGIPLNIVHRDVSPHNAMVSYNGEVKIMDFGIAKAAQRSTKTMAGTVKGKCAYMSPEQARGKPLDGRSDLFALGIMLWEMLTHKRLFLGDSDFETLTNVLKSEAPPPSSVNPDVPKALDDIVLRALQKDRDQRQPTVEAFGRELTRWFYSEVDDLDAVSVKGAMKELFADDIRKLHDMYAEESAMTLRLTSSGGHPHVGGADRTVAVPHGKSDPGMAPTMMEGALTAEQVEAALTGPVDSDGATVALPAAGNRAGWASHGSKPSQPQVGRVGTGDFQQATGAFPQGHTGTYGEKKKTGLVWALAAVLVALVGGVGFVAYKAMLDKPDAIAAGVPQDKEPAGRPGGVAAPGNATLKLKVDPYDAKVTADGKPVDGEVTGLAKGQKVTLVAESPPAYQRLEEVVTITSENQTHVLKLEKAADTQMLVVFNPSKPDATIVVDGKVLGTGTQKLSGAQGQVLKVEVRPAGGGPAIVKDVTIQEDGQIVGLELTQPAKLTIALDPEDATLTASKGSLAKDGTSWVLSGVDVGDKVTIEAKKAGFGNFLEDVTLDGPAGSLEVSLKKKEIEKGFGGLFINAKPWAKVTVDGQAKGTTPVTLSNLPSGKHKIVFTKGSETRTRTVTLLPNKKPTVFVDFTEPE